MDPTGAAVGGNPAVLYGALWVLGIIALILVGLLLYLKPEEECSCYVGVDSAGFSILCPGCAARRAERLVSGVRGPDQTGSLSTRPATTIEGKSE